jgi:hypothetical protein
LKKESRRAEGKLNFDSESSMFSVTSKSLPALGQVAELLFRLATDESLRKKIIRADDA